MVKKKKETSGERGACRIKVHIRLKKSTEEREEKATYNIFADATQLHIPNNKGRLELDRWYYFDHIYSPISSNKEVYKLCTFDLVESTLKGINTALFAYGTTGSGKTNTLMSKDGTVAHTVSHLFNRVWKRTEFDYKVNFTYYQIYNEHVYDLLNPKNNAGHTIKNDSDEEAFIENMVSVQCETPMDVYELLNIGRRTLFIAENKLNRAPNRSHVVCQLWIERKRRPHATHRSSMHETYSTRDCQSGRNREHNQSAIDFDTVPFDKAYLRKKHKSAVDKANNVNSIESSPVREKTTKDEQTNIVSRKNSANSQNGSIRRGSAISVLIQGSPRRPERELSIMSSGFSEDHLDISPITSSGFSEMSETDDNAHQNEASETCGANMGFRLSSTINASRQIGSSSPSHERITALSESSIDEYEKYYHDGENDNEVFTFPGEHDDDAFEEDTNFTLQKSKISIIDLAGSERLPNDPVVNYDAIKESKNINLSLLELGNVISALTSTRKTNKRIPYRNSVLTRLLRDSLGGNCKTKFLLCISTKMADANQSKSTLEFGQKLMKVYTKPLTNIAVNYKRKYEHLLKVMQEKETEYEQMQVEYTSLLQNAHQEIQIKETIIYDNELSIDSMQAQLYLADMVRKEFKKKVEKFQETLAEKDERLRIKEEELLKLNNEIKSLLEKIQSTSLSHVVTCDASTSTDTSPVATSDMGTTTCYESSDIGTNTCCESFDRGTNTFCETMDIGTDTLDINFNILKETCNASNNTLKIPLPLPIIVSFSKQANKVSTCDAETNTIFDRDFVDAPMIKNNKAPVHNSIIVTFLRDPKPTAKNSNTNTLTSARNDVTSGHIDKHCCDKKRQSVETNNVSTNTGLMRQTHKMSSTRPIVVTFIKDVMREINNPETLKLLKDIDTGLTCKPNEIDKTKLRNILSEIKCPKATREEPNDFDLIKHAISFELSNLKTLIRHERADVTELKNLETVKDGVVGIIDEVFAMLPSMLSECVHTSVTRGKGAAPASPKYSTAKDQLSFVQDHLKQRKQILQSNLEQIATEMTNKNTRNSSRGQDSEMDLIRKISDILSEKDFTAFESYPDKIRTLYNLIRSDVALTTCIIASQRWQRYDKHLEVIQSLHDDDVITRNIENPKVKKTLFGKLLRMRSKSGLR